MKLRRKKALMPAAPPAAPALAPESASPAPCDTRKKILVIDDDPIIVKTLSMTLGARGYNVVSAADGPQAITMMRQEKPDMMVVDVCLAPDVCSGGVVPWNGFQVIQWLQRMSDKKIPIIIISGTEKPAYKKQIAEVGASGFMAKPINNHLLIGSIDLMFSRDQKAKAKADANTEAARN
jgi:two-component system KDP operon response regulator KdpE